MGVFVFAVLCALTYGVLKLRKQDRRIQELELYVESVQKAVAGFDPAVVSANATE